MTSTFTLMSYDCSVCQLTDQLLICDSSMFVSHQLSLNGMKVKLQLRTDDAILR